jgi:hypothetical protein
MQRQVYIGNVARNEERRNDPNLILRSGKGKSVAEGRREILTKGIRGPFRAVVRKETLPMAMPR